MDLVQRLRDNVGPSEEWSKYADALQIEAAGEIERLRRDLAAAHSVIENIVVSEVEPLQAEVDRLQRENAALELLVKMRPAPEIREDGALIERCERLQAENAELIDWGRVVMEETVLAGYPGGDRDQTLKNIRAMRADAERLNYLEALMHRRQFQNQKRPTERVGSDLHMGDGSAALYIRDLFGNVANQGHGDTVRAAIDAARKGMS